MFASLQSLEHHRTSHVCLPCLDDWATLIPPFSVVLVKVEAIDCSVECNTDASKLAEAPALRSVNTCQSATMAVPAGIRQVEQLSDPLIGERAGKFGARRAWIARPSTPDTREARRLPETVSKQKAQ